MTKIAGAVAVCLCFYKNIVYAGNNFESHSKYGGVVHTQGIRKAVISM